MKIGILMNVYNEIDWIDTVLRSVEDWADEHVILEGAYQIAIKAGAEERSTDGTVDVLNDFQRRNRSVKVIHSNEQDERFQLQVGLEYLKGRSVDWYLLLDGDEVWPKKSLNLIRKYMEKGEKEGIYQYRANFYNFTNSFDLYTDGIFKRVFKLTPEARCVGQNGLEWPDMGLDVDVGGNSQSHISILPSFVRCFHYTEIKHKNRWLLKRDYLKNRDANPRFNQWSADESGFIHEEIKDLKRFTKQHPQIVQETELYKLWKTDIEAYKRELFGDK
jgi:glycosyltransferase involved in cell wall biosynthesis